MDTRIQFRVDEETKRLAQAMTESQGRSLSDACREMTEQLANEQKKRMSHDSWVTEQVNLAFERLDQGTADFVTQEEANAQMEDFKAKIRARG
ncbi:DNA-damage-inducible protein J [Marinomonas ushuaiensis DSM 15871]|uniref:DNA-damage-inducible protein J n=1 Tax=Marinomonas ushuaiensis DSM 15871 TaxID=1122207 RepID=X7E9H1_9GAMM|nr:damage-inducible protein J [Marinomonas ushuaiensis]ETX12480.1 DNA-damage-inducible protein J [Marinomonas ushuaiensis DSM 15871]